MPFSSVTIGPSSYRSQTTPRPARSPTTRSVPPARPPAPPRRVGRPAAAPRGGVHVPAGQGRRGLAGVPGGEVDVDRGVPPAPLGHVVAGVGAHREAELAFVELPGALHVRYREPPGH